MFLEYEGLSIPDNFQLPLMHDLYQEFEHHEVTNISQLLKQTLQSSPNMASVRPGKVVAIAVGSRGIANISLIVSTIVNYLKTIDVTPIVIPTMGSHGGATTVGQIALLEHYGITEEIVNAQIIASVDSVPIGKNDENHTIHINKLLVELADAVIPVVRIKPHTNFNGPVQSGIHKMIAVGFGGPVGAMNIHRTPFIGFSKAITSVARVVISRLDIPCAVAVVEDAYDHTGMIEVVERESFSKREPELLRVSKSWLPKVPLKSLDVLIVDKIGKNISGSGMDPNIIGRGIDGGPSADIDVDRIVVLDLTDETEGNAAGIGRADIITKRAINRVDWNATYTNHLTSRMLPLAKLPLVASSDRDAISIALKSLYKSYDQGKVRIAWISDTAHIDHIKVSTGCLPSIEQPVIDTGQFTMEFADGRLGWNPL